MSRLLEPRKSQNSGSISLSLSPTLVLVFQISAYLDTETFPMNPSFFPSLLSDMAGNDLTPELVSIIADHLPLADIFTLRRTCKSYADNSMESIQRDRMRLYLHPTRLQEALDVCAHSSISKKISEIVILGQSTFDMESPRGPVFAEIETLPPEYEADYQRMFDESRRRLHVDNHSWPHTVPAVPEPRSLRYGWNESQKFRTAFATLFQALRNLTGLNTITYSGSASKSGFCPVSAGTISSHGEAYRDSSTLFDSSSWPQLEKGEQRIRWSDAEVMAGILISNITPYTTLTMEQPLPLCGSVRWDALLETRGAGDSEANWRFVFETIGHSATHCSIAIPGTIEYVPFVRGCLSAMHTLQSLELRLAVLTLEMPGCPLTSHLPPRRPIHPFWEGRIILPQIIVTPNEARDFQHLQISGEAFYPLGIPVDQVVELLQRHKTSLRSVKLKNVFSDWQIRPDPQVNSDFLLQQDMKAVSNRMSDELNLESAEFSLRRLQCHPCSEKRGLLDGECFCCTTYSTAHGAMLYARGLFDDLAQQIGIQVSQDR